MSLNAAIVGYGRRAEEHAAALREVDGVELRGVVDPAALRRTAAESDLEVPAFAELGRMLDEIEPEIVLVTTPADVRGEPVERLAEASPVRAIMVEKPFAHGMAEAESMLAACDRAGVLLTVGHQLRFAPPFLALKAAIESDELGSIEFIRGSCFGHLLDQGPHLIDTIRWVTGGRRVQWAMSQGGRDVVPASRSGSREDLARGIPAWSTHHLALEGGVRATLETGVLHQRSDRFGQDDQLDDFLDKRLTVIGSRGIAQCVAAGDCRILIAGEPDWRVHRGGFEAYVGANRAFHQELRDAVLNGTAHRADAHDALESLEAMIACARSLTEGEAVPLPLAARSAVRPSAPEETNLEVSVILPLAEHRGYAEDALRSWTREQTFDRGRYEVIVGFDGAEAGLQERVQHLLGPPDRVLRREGAPEIDLYDEGARIARGRILLFTEPHCIADPSYIEETLTYLARTGEVGAVGTTIGIDANFMARAEDALYEKGIAVWRRPGHWCRVIMRGTAIDRRTFLEVGGFQTRYGRFAEFALAAKLHAAGKQMGFAPGAIVRHAYTTSFSSLEPHVIDFVAGEIDYRFDYPESYCQRYFGTPREWVERRRLSREGARAAFGICLRALFRPSSWRQGSAGSHLRALWRVTPAALLGATAARLRANLHYAAARARTHLWRWDEKRMLRAYEDAYERLGIRTRVRRIAAVARERDPGGAPPFALADLSDDRLFGFHPKEQSNGTRFRWSGSVAYAEVPLDPGRYRVEIDTGGLRDPRSLGVQVFFNETRIPSRQLDVDTRAIRFAVEPEQFAADADQRVGLACPSFTPAKVADSPDTRELGLPISTMSFEPMQNGGG